MNKPNRCRNVLKDKGYPYPKSGCEVCGNGGLAGCLYENEDREYTQQIAAEAYQCIGALVADEDFDKEEVQRVLTYFCEVGRGNFNQESVLPVQLIDNFKD